MADRLQVRKAESVTSGTKARGTVVSFKLQAWLVAVLAAGVLAAWIRSRRDPGSKTARGRLRQLGWCLAFAALTISVTATVSSLFERAGMVSALLLIAVCVAVLLALMPSLAARIVPLMLIMLGLFGFVVVRDSVLGFGGVNAYGLTLVGNPGFEADLVLPQAYALLLGGGWLAWRSTDPVLARSLLLLGKVTALGPRAQLRALLLLPAAVITAALINPVLWLGHGAGLYWSVLIVGGAVFVLRRWPELAARIAAAAIVGLGLAGLWLVANWYGVARFPGAWHGYVMDGAVLIRPERGRRRSGAGARAARSWRLADAAGVPPDPAPLRRGGPAGAEQACGAADREPRRGRGYRGSGLPAAGAGSA